MSKSNSEWEEVPVVSEEKESPASEWEEVPVVKAESVEDLSKSYLPEGYLSKKPISEIVEEIPEKAELSARSALKGFSFGLSEAGLKGLLKSLGREDLTKASEERLASQEAKYPGTALAAEITGGLRSPGIVKTGLGVLKGLKTAGTAAERVAKGTDEAAKILSKLKPMKAAGTSALEGTLQSGIYAAAEAPEGQALNEGVSSGFWGGLLAGGLHAGGATVSKASDLLNKFKDSKFSKVYKKSQELDTFLEDPKYKNKLADEYTKLQEELLNRSNITKEQMAKDLHALDEKFLNEIKTQESLTKQIGEGEELVKGKEELSSQTRKSIKEVDSLIKEEEKRLTGIKASEIEGELGPKVNEFANTIIERKLSPAFAEVMDKAESTGKKADISSEVQKILADIPDNLPIKRTIEDMLSGYNLSSISPKELETLRKQVQKQYAYIRPVAPQVSGQLRAAIGSGMSQVSEEVQPLLDSYKKVYDLETLAGTGSEVAKLTDISQPFIKSVKGSKLEHSDVLTQPWNYADENRKKAVLQIIQDLDPAVGKEVDDLSKELLLLQHQSIRNPSSETFKALSNKKIELNNLVEKIEQTKAETVGKIQNLKTSVNQSKVAQQDILKNKSELESKLKEQVPEEASSLIRDASLRDVGTPEQIQRGREAFKKLQDLFPEQKDNITRIVDERQLLRSVSDEPTPSVGGFDPKYATGYGTLKTPYTIASYLGKLSNNDLGKIIRKVGSFGASAAPLVEQLTRLSTATGQQKAALLFQIVQKAEDRELIRKSLNNP